VRGWALDSGKKKVRYIVVTASLADVGSVLTRKDADEATLAMLRSVDVGG
jgi:hypothetical protein